MLGGVLPRLWVPWGLCPLRLAGRRGPRRAPAPGGPRMALVEAPASLEQVEAPCGGGGGVAQVEIPTPGVYLEHQHTAVPVVEVDLPEPFATRY